MGKISDVNVSEILPFHEKNRFNCGACSPWCNIPSFRKKMCIHLGSEETNCWSFGGGMSSHSCLMQESESSFFSLPELLFDDRPNAFCWWKVWTAGRPVQHLDSSTVKSSCCDGCSMWFSNVLLKYARTFQKETMSGWEHMLFLNLWYCLHTTLVLHITTLQTEHCYKDMSSWPHCGTNAFWTEHWQVRQWLSSLVCRTWCPRFPKRTKNFDLPYFYSFLLPLSLPFKASQYFSWNGKISQF